ncbi:hypothetical protein LCGC14_0650330 [marine sediment metagenome]|uniref:Uncharacterized protein n=1 Tax=marine sediment metagenome TaxID=412755 RepID=A0A0F9R1U1_9ZZZZ|nr:hypothetical protein [Candidatus Aminicenantes bacterium]
MNEQCVSYCNWCSSKFNGIDVIYKGYHQHCWDRNKDRIEGLAQTLEERVELLEERVRELEEENS